MGAVRNQSLEFIPERDICTTSKPEAIEEAGIKVLVLENQAMNQLD